MAREKNSVLYLYAGFNRKKLLEMCGKNSAPDSSFFGFTHLKKIHHGKVSFLEIGQFLSYKAELLIRRYLSFNLVHVFLFFKIRKYDFVISSVALPLLFMKSFLISKPKWIIFNIHLSNLLKRNKSKKIKYNFLLYTIKKADMIVCLSNKQIDYLASLGVCRNKLVFIPFGVDSNYFKYAKENEGYILSVGRDNGRDYKTLVEAARDIKNNFIIIASKRNMKNIIDIPSNVKVLYDLEYEEVRRFYEKAKIIVVPSTNENFLDGSDCSGQTTILDAMACGKPVIASYRSWMDDYFNNEELMIIKPENKEILKNAINYLINNKEVASNYGFKARKAIEEKYNSKNMAKQIHDLINNKKCKICGSSNLSKKYKVDNYNYLICNDCKIVFLDQNFTKDDISKIYNDKKYLSENYKFCIKESKLNSYFAMEDRLRIHSKRTQDEIRKTLKINNIKIGSKLLDVGCAAGFFLDVARANGYEPFGIEISDEGANHARNNYNIEIISKDLLKLDDNYNNFFDMVTMFDVLEHLDEPTASLKKVYEILKSGRVLVVEVPNIKTIDTFSYRNLVSILQPPHHLFLFNPNNLRLILEKNGFKIIEEKLYFSDLLGRTILKFLSIMKMNKMVNKKLKESKERDIINEADKEISTSDKSGFVSGLRKIIIKIFPGSKMRFVCIKKDF